MADSLDLLVNIDGSVDGLDRAFTKANQIVTERSKELKGSFDGFTFDVWNFDDFTKRISDAKLHVASLKAALADVNKYETEVSPSGKAKAVITDQYKELSNQLKQAESKLNQFKGVYTYLKEVMAGTLEVNVDIHNLSSVNASVQTLTNSIEELQAKLALKSNLGIVSSEQLTKWELMRDVAQTRLNTLKPIQKQLETEHQQQITRTIQERVYLKVEFANSDEAKAEMAALRQRAAELTTALRGILGDTKQDGTARAAQMKPIVAELEEVAKAARGASLQFKELKFAEDDAFKRQFHDSFHLNTNPKDLVSVQNSGRVYQEALTEVNSSLLGKSPDDPARAKLLLARGYLTEFINELKRLEGPLLAAKKAEDDLFRKRMAFPPVDMHSLAEVTADLQRIEGKITEFRQKMSQAIRVGDLEGVTDAQDTLKKLATARGNARDEIRKLTPKETETGEAAAPVYVHVRAVVDASDLGALNANIQRCEAEALRLEIALRAATSPGTITQLQAELQGIQGELATDTRLAGQLRREMIGVNHSAAQPALSGLALFGTRLQEVHNEYFQRFGQMSMMANQLGTSLIFAGGGMSALVGYTLKAADSLQRIQVAFHQISANQHYAIGTDSILLKQIKELSSHTAISAPDLYLTGQRLMSAKLKPQDIAPMLRTIGDAAATARMSGADISRLISSFAELANEPYVDQRRLRSIFQDIKGFSPWDSLKSELNLTKEQMAKLTKGKLQIPSAIGLKALMTAMQKQFHGQMQKYVDTTPSGKLAAEKNKLWDMAAHAGQSMIPIAMKFLGVLDKLIDKFNNLSPGMKDFIVKAMIFAGLGTIAAGGLLKIGSAALMATFMLKGLRAAGGGAGMFDGVNGGVSSLLSGLLRLPSAFMNFNLGRIFTPFINGIRGIPALITNIRPGISSGFQGMMNGVRGIFSGGWAGIKGLFSRGVAGLRAILASPIVGAAVFAGLIAGLVALYEHNADFHHKVNLLWNKMKGHVDKIMNDLLGIVEKILNQLSGFWDRHGDTVVDIVERFMESVGTIFGGILELVDGILSLLSGDWNSAWHNMAAGMKDILWGAVKDSFGIFKGFFNWVSDTAADMGRGGMEEEQVRLQQTAVKHGREFNKIQRQMDVTPKGTPQYKALETKRDSERKLFNHFMEEWGKARADIHELDRDSTKNWKEWSDVQSTPWKAKDHSAEVKKPGGGNKGGGGGYGGWKPEDKTKKKKEQLSPMQQLAQDLYEIAQKVKFKILTSGEEIATAKLEAYKKAFDGVLSDEKENTYENKHKLAGWIAASQAIVDAQKAMEAYSAATKDVIAKEKEFGRTIETIDEELNNTRKAIEDLTKAGAEANAQPIAVLTKQATELQTEKNVHVTRDEKYDIDIEGYEEMMKAQADLRKAQAEMSAASDNNERLTIGADIAALQSHIRYLHEVAALQDLTTERMKHALNDGRREQMAKDRDAVIKQMKFKQDMVEDQLKSQAKAIADEAKKEADLKKKSLEEFVSWAEIMGGDKSVIAAMKFGAEHAEEEKKRAGTSAVAIAPADFTGMPTKAPLPPATALAYELPGAAQPVEYAGAPGSWSPEDMTGAPHAATAQATITNFGQLLLAVIPKAILEGFRSVGNHTGAVAPAAATHTPDFTNKYNTKLSAKEESSFQAWAKKNNRLRDLFDYDMRGAWLATKGKAAGNGHFPDTFKKPNHPSYSNESEYSKNGPPGGVWGREHGKDTFTPASTNLQYHSATDLRDYFKRVEPNALLKMPVEAPAPVAVSPGTAAIVKAPSFTDLLRQFTQKLTTGILSAQPAQPAQPPKVFATIAKALNPQLPANLSMAAAPMAQKSPVLPALPAAAQAMAGSIGVNVDITVKPSPLFTTEIEKRIVKHDLDMQYYSAHSR